MKFTYKGYGRIYVTAPEDVQKVHEVIKEIDEYEYTGYMPKDLVAPFSEYPAVVYLHKFNDIDLNKIAALCWGRGVPMWFLDAGHNDWVTDVREYDDSGNFLPGKAE